MQSAIDQAWLKNLDISCSLSPVVLLLGERITDRFVVTQANGGSGKVTGVDRAIWMTLQSKYQALVRFDPLRECLSSAFQLADCSAMTAVSAELNRPNGRVTRSLESLLDFVIDQPNSLRGIILIEDADFLFAGSEERSLGLIQRLVRLSSTAVPDASGLFSPLIVVGFRQASAVPERLFVDGIRQIRLGLPTRDERLAYAQRLVPSLEFAGNPLDLSKTLASQTEGQLLNNVQRVLDLIRQKDCKEISAIEHMTRAVKDGLSDTPWAGAALREAVAGARTHFGARIKGQEPAIEAVVRQLRRSTLNLSSVRPGGTTGPRATLFFAGPTGVGKTDLAKSIAELVFGDEAAMVRFDMGEFSDAHSDARLVGAPPGYIGFSQGGELTEAVRNRPFSVLLFDEIEKAHPKILDKFLSLLDDGRVTDGRGQMARFSETIVIFTSNLGANQVSHADDYETVSTTIRQSINEHFSQTINRPELLGRIGIDNLVVFDFIRPDIAKLILQRWLDLYLKRILDVVKVKVDLSDSAMEQIQQICLDPKVLAFGGRQIVKTLEARLITPLSDLLFDSESKSSMLVTSIAGDNVAVTWRS